MKSVISQFYSLFRESMFANKLTASDLSTRMGVHYTYIYNTIRKNANITLATAQKMAEAAGYNLVVTFEPIDTAAELVGTMDSTGGLYSQRRTKTAVKAAEAAEVEAEVAAQPSEAELDTELAELLALENT